MLLSWYIAAVYAWNVTVPVQSCVPNDDGEDVIHILSTFPFGIVEELWCPELSYSQGNTNSRQRKDKIAGCGLCFRVDLRDLLLLIGWQKGHLALKNLCQLSSKVLFQDNYSPKTDG